WSERALLGGRGRRLQEVVKGTGQAAEASAGQKHRAPLLAPDPHVLAIVFDRDGAKKIALAAEGPQIGSIVGERFIRKNVMAENQKRLVVRTEEPAPLQKAADIIECRPAFPYARLTLARAGRKAASLDVKQQASPVLAVNDEVEALHRGVAEKGTAGFIHGDIADAVPLQVRLE